MQLNLLKSTLLMLFLVTAIFVPCDLAGASKAKQTIQSQYFIVIPDIHNNSYSSALPMNLSPNGPATKGLINNVDSANLNSTLNAFQQQLQQFVQAQPTPPAFIIFLGDMVRNGDDDDPPARLSDETRAFTFLKSTFPNIPIFYVFGNHDSVQEVWGSFYSTTPGAGPNSPYEVAELNGWSDGFLSTGAVCNLNKSFSGPCLISENTQIGFYSAYLQPGLRLVALNTPLLDVQALNPSASDISTQFTWFNAQLSDAAANNESVLIAMHVPLGSSLDSLSSNSINSIVPSYNTQLLQIISNYRKNVIGMLAGHTHMDSMRVFTQASNKVNFLINPAALSTHSGNAPSFQTVTFYNNQQLINNAWIISDYETFKFVATNGANNQQVGIQSVYKFSDYYCNGAATNMMDCLGNITAAKMSAYHTAGNPNYSLPIANPQNIFIELPPSTIPPLPPSPKPQPAHNDSNGGSGGNSGAIAAAVAGAAIIGGAIVGSMEYLDSSKDN